MTLVNHNQSVVLLCEVANLVHRGDVAVHREHAVGDDDAEALCLCLLQTLLQFLHVGVCVAVAFCLAKAHTVDDGCMVEGIADDGVLFREERLEHTAVSVEASGIEDGVLRLEVVADGCLELFVDVLRAADEAHARHAEAPFCHHLCCSLYEARMVAEAEIVVGAEVQDFLALYLNGCPLRAFNETLLFVESCFANLSERLAEMLFHLSVHDLVV